MKTYRLKNYKLDDFIEFEAENDEQAKRILKLAFALRDWVEEDCACWTDQSSYDDYKWEDSE